MRTLIASPRAGEIIGCLVVTLLGCGGGDDGRGSGDDDGTGSISLSVGSLTINPDSDANDSDEEIFDVAGTDLAANGGDCGGPMGMGTNDYSIIWIANSPEGTVSKIDTKTGLELARYFTGPTDGLDDPSRTSVNLEGDVAVANRAGGLTKFASRNERCIDRNANGSIETSTGPAIVLPFGTDECMLWHVTLPFPEGDATQGPRPTSWDAGGDDDPCAFANDRVWNGWWERSQNTAYFRRFAGSDGSQLDEVVVPGWDTTQSKTYGPYGGATDGDGNFWVTGLQGPLVRIDGDDLSVQGWEVPAESYPYGMTVDANGHVWSAGLNGEIMHFDPTTQTFDMYPVMGAFGPQSLRGIMIDRNGMAWAAANSPCALIQFDTASRTLVNANIALPGCATPVGVSIDVDGFVWVPDQAANLAYKVSPIDYTSTTTMGLLGPYTYSDMTGAGLGLVTNPPAG